MRRTVAVVGLSAAAFASLYALDSPPVLGADPAAAEGAPPAAVARLERPVANELATQCAVTVPTPAHVRRADRILSGDLTLGPHASVRLGDEPEWAANPFDEGNWQFQLHTLRWVDALKLAWDATGDERYLGRYRDLLKHWYEHNPVEAPPSPFSWNDHSTAFRAMGYACAAEVLPTERWVVAALALHGRMLADPDFYVGHGNHALNQATGLLAVGCVIGREPWIELAIDRLAALAEESIDEQGVANEQSVEYQYYDWTRYHAALDRIESCGWAPPASLGRVDRMADFLAHATMPDGYWAQIGDTELRPAEPIPGTISEFAATGGERGPRPQRTSVVFDEGFVFARSGWGDDRPFSDESFVSLRFGAPRRLHGHFDGGSINFFAGGQLALHDSGKYLYAQDPGREYVISRAAQNVVVVNRPFDPGASTPLLYQREGDGYVMAIVGQGVYEDVVGRRAVLYLPGFDLLVVDEGFAADTEAQFAQLWRLPPGSSPVVEGHRISARGGRIVIDQLVAVDGIELAEGEHPQWPSWTSPRYGDLVPSPRVVSSVVGDRARFVTVIAGDADRAFLRGHEVDDAGIRLQIEHLGQAYEVTWTGTDVAVRPLG